MVKNKSIGFANVPEGIKIIGVLYYVGAAITLILGGILLSFSDSVRQNAEAFVQQGVQIPSHGTLLIIGLALLGGVILQYFLARGIIKFNRLARFVIAFLSALGVVGAIMNLKDGMPASGTFSLVANGLIVWYLLFNKKIRVLFK